ncbi:MULTISPECIES: lipopolysaccharide biosynthesis protein [unclassified Pseudoalteromonas]|uniref:lipopolysaccharide biosynthesis protein n=1 Tax=unclassified Pseudoalteromonas TaxID=194690 RepID=UPI001EF15149|nr:lipopolysaccharide biosynthesis protein [Pseudoalteromonas sp. L21]MCF7519579.1 lipopolysaccharide biosynthesis protein [Pseudoalteromonas sp. L21]UJX25885.1 lipopolysaccharide biosynthesis protein [Pseudoalteromonas sp. CF6-2]|tara:strand:+ start:10834 stop:12258 length:1425 start_codon:yes stop_codon:yes gene_type:complete
MHDKKKIKSGFIWSALDSLGTQAIALATSLVLANILGPAVFGLIAMLAIFIAVANVFINSGFNAALIRKTDRDESDFATTFYFSLGVSIGCYLLLFFCAPYIAQFYQQPELTTLTRVIALVVVINTFSAIPIVKLSVSLNFKTQAKCNFIALTCSSLLALALAYFDHGVWALVAQQLALAIINVLMLNILVPWRPKRKFSKESFKNLFGFGSKLLLSGLLDTIYNNIYSLIIGKQFTAVQLGLFNQANRLSSLPAVTLTGVIQKVTFPMLSAIQHDTKKLDASYLLTLQFAAVVIFPVMFGLCIIAKPLIEILLGQEWQGTAELVSIITMALVLYPIHAINLNMLQVKGRSDLFLKLEIIKKITITLILVVTVPMGIKAMCIGMVVSSYLALFINTYYTGKLSSLTAYKQLIALLPIALITAFSAFLGYSVGMNFSSNIIQIITMLGVALGSYILILILMQRSLLIALKNTLKN